uniref:Fibronectin type-III domain-containing protein n=1 Tax=Panagrolaimus superbus TaxID=310955 RepID=A0A914Y846_9BILA
MDYQVDELVVPLNPNAVYCNCPDDFSESRTTSEVPGVETIYKDVRTIKVILKKPFPSSFIYVFEYSAVSDFSNKWIYAGSSSSPQMTFTIPDSCRDYQFRVLVVVRSTDPRNQLIVFQPRAIPVELPNFAVPSEMIRLDPPRQSSDGQSLHVFVSWQIPQGYFDSDIIGYESPVAYPIRCMIPEESLSQPHVEKVQDGARMHLNLPIDVLDENCRIYLEVRMLAKCERIIPFDVQASVELNCQKFPMLDYCKKEMSPQCAEIVDVWGENGKAQIVWQPPVPNRLPLYYQISHGVTRSQVRPLKTDKI